jgi:hypothetical protein
MGFFLSVMLEARVGVQQNGNHWIYGYILSFKTYK